MDRTLMLTCVFVTFLLALGAIAYWRVWRVREKKAVRRALAPGKKAEHPIFVAAASKKAEDKTIIAVHTQTAGEALRSAIFHPLDPRIVVPAALNVKEPSLIAPLDLKLKDPIGGLPSKEESSSWRSNSYLSGSPDRSDSGGRL